MKVREDSFLGREGDLLITGLHVIMMCVRALVGAFVLYNDAWSQAPSGSCRVCCLSAETRASDLSPP